MRPQRPAAGVYIVHAPSCDLYKIGCSQAVKTRVINLRHSSPVPIELVVWVRLMGKNWYDYEQALHQRFARSRHHGEWFKSSKDLVEFVSENHIRTGRKWAYRDVAGLWEIAKQVPLKVPQKKWHFK